MKEKIKELNKLIEENPELEIKMFVDSDELSEYSLTSQRITSVEKSLWFQGDEQIFTDVEDVIEDKFYDLEYEDAEREAKKLMSEVILIYTGA